jgi:hypothetical protein
MRGGGENDQNDLEVEGVFSESGKLLHLKPLTPVVINPFL